MTRLAEYVKTYYPVFLFGAVFARLMEKGGLAASVAAKIVDVLGEKLSPREVNARMRMGEKMLAAILDCDVKEIKIRLT